MLRFCESGVSCVSSLASELNGVKELGKKSLRPWSVLSWETDCVCLYQTIKIKIEEFMLN